MRICQEYPRPAKLLENEQSTLKFLTTDPDSWGDCTSLGSQARRALDRSRAGALYLSFEAHYDVRHEGSRMRLLFGALVSGRSAHAYEHVSYYLALCRSLNEARDDWELLRKFHFDHDPLTEAHPCLHLQYAGESPPSFGELGLCDDHLYPWLSAPRVTCPPMSLALLLHFAFAEFRDENTVRFSERKCWREIVCRDEALMLSWYYMKCGEHFQGSTGGSRLLFDRFYNGSQQADS